MIAKISTGDLLLIGYRSATPEFRTCVSSDMSVTVDPWRSYCVINYLPHINSYEYMIRLFDASGASRP